MNEKHIERKLIDGARERGGLALKFTSPGMVGMPDRMVIFPEGILAFVELKAPGQKPRKIQMERHRMLREFGFKVFVADTPERVMEVLDEIHSS